MVVYAHHLGNQRQLNAGDTSEVTGRKWPAAVYRVSSFRPFGWTPARMGLIDPLRAVANGRFWEADFHGICLVAEAIDLRTKPATSVVLELQSGSVRSSEFEFNCILYLRNELGLRVPPPT